MAPHRHSSAAPSSHAVGAPFVLHAPPCIPPINRRQEQQEVKLRKMAEKLLLNQLKRAALDEASQQALQQATRPSKKASTHRQSPTEQPAPADNADNDDAADDVTLEERAAQLARRIAKGKQPAIDASLPTADADALLAAQLALEEVQGGSTSVVEASGVPARGGHRAAHRAAQRAGMPQPQVCEDGCMYIDYVCAQIASHCRMQPVLAPKQPAPVDRCWALWMTP